MLLKMGEIPDTPRFTLVPEPLLSQCMVAREMAQRFLAEKMATALHQMLTIINSKADGLRALDRSFECEIGFLNEAVERMSQAHIRKLALACSLSGITISPFSKPARASAWSSTASS